MNENDRSDTSKAESGAREGPVEGERQSSEAVDGSVDEAPRGPEAEGREAGTGSGDTATGLKSPVNLSDQDISRIQVGILLLLGAGAIYLIGRLFWPFMPAIVTSAVLAVLFFPAYRRFEGWVRQRDVAAFLGTLIIFFVVLVPMLAVSLILVDQVVAGIDWATRAAEELTAPEGRLRTMLEAAFGYLGVPETELPTSVREEMQDLLQIMAGRTITFLTGLGGWLLQAGVAIFTLFYLLRDADGIIRAGKWLVPLETDQTDRLFQQAREAIYATVYGHVVVAIVQGVLGGLVFWALGLPAAALWGTVMGILSLLPVVGPFLVWTPAGLLLILQDEVARGVALLIIGALVISMVDNYLRAILVSDRIHLHPLAVFISVLGGLFLFGAVGIFVGPIIFVLCLSLAEMARLAMEPTLAAAPEGGGLLLTESSAEGAAGDEEEQPEASPGS